MQEVIHVLKKYDVDLERGFLPSQDPFTKLANRYEEWEILAQNLTTYINAGIVRERIDIMKQAKQKQATAKGTGGTNPMVFLKSVRNQNAALVQSLSKR